MRNMSPTSAPAGTAKTPKSLSKTTATTACLVATALALSACSWNEKRTETLGGVVGGIMGGLLGSKLGGGTGRDITMVLGATLGAMWGQDIAKGMSEADKVYSQRTTEDTLEYGKPGETVTWSNPDSGNSGTVTPQEVYANDQGEDCRQFETTVHVEGEERTANGTACKTADGEWQIVDTPEVAT